MTLILELDLDLTEMWHHTKNDTLIETDTIKTMGVKNDKINHRPELIHHTVI